MNPALAPPPPRELQIEVTGSCNLRCRMCLVSYRPELGRREGAFDLRLFQALIEENPQLERVTLQRLGEPLLAPDLVGMVELVSERGIDMGFNTNGMLLTERRAEQLVRAGLGWLHISLDGVRADTYAGIRGRGDLGRVARIRDFAEEEALWNGDDLERPGRLFTAARREAGRLDVDLRLPRLREAAARAGAARRRPACDWPWRSAYVTHEGVVQPCCMVMGSDRVRLGDLKGRRFSEIWSGESYAAFPRGLTGEGAPHPVCAGCSVYHGVF